MRKYLTVIFHGVKVDLISNSWFRSLYPEASFVTKSLCKENKRNSTDLHKKAFKKVEIHENGILKKGNQVWNKHKTMQFLDKRSDLKKKRAKNVPLDNH